MADTSEGTLAVIAEVTPGVIPATPAFKNLRITSESLTAAYDTIVSAEIRPDATVSDVRRTGVSVSGDVNFELHKDSMLDVLIAAMIRGTWTTNVAKGALLKPTFTFERKIVGSDATARLRFSGSRITGGSLSFTPDENVTGTFRVTGTAHTAAEAIVTGATYASASTNPVMAGIDVTSLVASGITGVDYTSMTLDIDNTTRIQRKLGTTAARGVGFGRRTVTGTLVCFFESLAAYNTFLNDATPSIICTVGDGTNSYTFTLGRVRITGGDVPQPGNDADFMLTLTFQATYDSVTSTDIQIARAP